MNTHDIDIELPPLPEPFTYTLPGKSEGALYHAGHMRDYARAAVEADRQQRHLKEESQIEREWVHLRAMQAQYEADRKRRGEPVAWLYEDELPDNYPYEVMFAYSKVDGVRMFPVYTPQPAEPVVNQSLTTEPSDVLADTQRAIIEAAEQRGYERGLAECTQDREDSERYRLLRRGQHWSVINGIGEALRAESLDAAIDAARAAKEQS